MLPLVAGAPFRAVHGVELVEQGCGLVHIRRIEPTSVSDRYNECK